MDFLEESLTPEVESVSNENGNGIKVEELLTFSKHTSWVFDLIYFQKKKILVSCSQDASVAITNLNFNPPKETLLKEHGGKSVTSIVKLSETEFASCGVDGCINCYSIDTMKKTHVVYEDCNKLYRLLRLSGYPDILASVKDDGKLIMCNYTKSQKVVQTVSGKDIQSNISFGDATKMIHSLNNKTCFFFNSNDTSIYNVNRTNEESTIFMLNYKTMKIEKELKPKTHRIFSMSNFVNHRDEEIIVAGGLEKFVYIFNTSTGTFFKHHESASLNDYILSTYSFCVRREERSFFLIGDNNHGSEYLYEIFEEGKRTSQLSASSINEDGIFKLIPIEKTGNSMKIASASFHCHIRILKFTNLPFIFEEEGPDAITVAEQKDLRERVDYLLQEEGMDRIFSLSSDVKNMILFVFKIRSESAGWEWEFPRIFLFL